MTDLMPTEAGSIRTVYLANADHEALHAIARAQGVSVSALIRTFFADYLNGKLTPVKDRPRKTSVWMPMDEWTLVREKTTSEKTSIGEVIAAGLDRLRGK